jgi:hypothetical protein
MTMPVETKPFPQIEQRTDPFSRLAVAVISQAIEDATNQLGSKKKSATTWLLQDKDGSLFGVTYWEWIPIKLGRSFPIGWLPEPNDAMPMSLFALEPKACTRGLWPYVAQ